MTDEEKRIVWDIVENAYNKILKLNSVISEKNAEIEQLKGKIQVDEQVKDVKDKITNLFIDFDVMGFAPTTLCEDTEQYAKDWRRDLVVEIQKLTTIREEPTTKTEQEQLKEMQEIIGDCYEFDSIGAELGSGDGYINIEEAANALIKAGYGSVSEYKTEIEKIKAENDKLNKKIAELEQDLVHANEKVFYREMDVKLSENKLKKQGAEEFSNIIKEECSTTLTGAKIINKADIEKLLKRYIG